jgi:hypothetical protein
MTDITIAGHKFTVPEGVLARYQIGYTLADEGEVSTIRQTLCENLRNNFANKVKTTSNGGELTQEQMTALQADFEKYAGEYKFGVRSAGGGGRRVVDPTEREMIKLAKEDIGKAYFAKYGEKLGKDQKEWLEEKVEQLLEAKHDDYAKRARAIMRQREATAGELGVEV